MLNARTVYLYDQSGGYIRIETGEPCPSLDLKTQKVDTIAALCEGDLIHLTVRTWDHTIRRVVHHGKYTVIE